MIYPIIIYLSVVASALFGLRALTFWMHSPCKHHQIVRSSLRYAGFSLIVCGVTTFLWVFLT